jgi:hypothetical protein
LKQLSGIADTASADFILKLKRDFFTEETRVLMQLLDNDWLTLVSVPRSGDDARDDYFVVEERKISSCALHNSIKSRLLSRKAYSTYDLDDLMLGHFEDVGLLLQKEVLETDMVLEEFGWYLKTAWESREIQKYIAQERPAAPRLYDKFEYAYRECQRYAEIKGR